MDQQLKQRLVGIGVIFSLAVIFLPMILDGSGQRRQTLEFEIPPPPDIESKVDIRQKVIEIEREVSSLPELQPLIVDETSPAAVNDTVDEAESEPEAPADSEPTVAAVDPTPKKPVKQPVKKAQSTAKPKTPATVPVGGQSWVIQIGSFRERERAFKQRDRLRQSKLAAVFIEQYEKEPGKLSYRVRMGPFLDKTKANVVRNKVLAKYDIKGLVMQYER